MTTLRRTVLALVISSFLGQAAMGQESTTKVDDICQRLFETYIVKKGMMSNGSTVTAADHIVAERGRSTGFWKIVLKELRKDSKNSEIACVRVLGKMLAIDARARDILRGEKRTPWPASVELAPEVAKELIARGKKADRHRITHYCIALARARVPEAKAFFTMILNNGRGIHYSSSTKFHAALGLAHLADPKGFEWLIANCDVPRVTVGIAWPSRSPTVSLRTCKNVSTCCVAALQELSGKPDLSTRQEWQSWWKSVDRKTLPVGHVELSSL